jgi:S-DNA-T family DNA segregation ATPase FtsK/SpoIIIE
MAKNSRKNLTNNKENSSLFQHRKFKNKNENLPLIFGVALIVLALILFLGFLNLAGPVGQYLAKGLRPVFGWAAWSLPLILFILSIFLWQRKKISLAQILGLLSILLAISALFHLYFLKDKTALLEQKGGGYLGYALSFVLNLAFGSLASAILLLAFLTIGLVLIFSSFKKEEILKKEAVAEILVIKQNPLLLFWQAIKKIFPKKELKLKKEVSQGGDVLSGSLAITKDKEPSPLGAIKKRKINFVSRPVLGGKLNLPLDLLEDGASEPNSGDIKANRLTIQKTLENFGIKVEMGEVKVGPTITQYTLKPAEGTKLAQITALANELALALAKHPIRIEAPIPGQSLVGVEVPNERQAVVRLKELLNTENFKKKKSNLTIALGKDVAGDVWLADLGKMPHLLVAGATGSGKTVMLNAIIITLLYQNSPDDLKLILIDPKRVELILYNDIPHLLAPVITDVSKTIQVLRWTVSEMDRRFSLLAEAKKRDIESYNAETQEKIPYLVVVIDELADLMVVAPTEVESYIIRLTQMARATGIHLIMATQRPSVDIITGLIKANITSRIAFSVASMVDSRTILDFAGAEKLLGRGDMLFISPEIFKPKRLQAAYISDKEIKRVVEYLRNLRQPEYELNLEDLTPQQDRDLFLKDDELLPQAREVVLSAKKASASLLQRRLRIGYARAARLLDLLEEEGTIGPADGAKPREVLKTKEDFLDNSN